MKKIKKYENYYIFDNIKELLEKVDIDKYRTYYIDEYLYPDWYEYIEEDFERLLEYFGFEDIECNWDVSYSQGSGASFTGLLFRNKFNYKEIKEFVSEDKELLNISKTLKDLIESEKDLFYAKIKRINNYYYHQNTVEAVCFDEEDNILYGINTYFNDIVYDLSTWFFNRLQKEYDYFISNEGIAEELITNETEIPEIYLKKEYIDESTTNN